MARPSQQRRSLRGNATTSARNVTMGSGADRAAASVPLILTTLYKTIITVIITAFRIG